MSGWSVLGLVGVLIAPGAAFAQTVTVKEARVWKVGDADSMKRIGADPRVTVDLSTGKVAPESCAAIARSTKLARVLWRMKGKAYTFNLRAPVALADGKKTIAGQLSVDVSGKTTVDSCELVAYSPKQDDPPEWPEDEI